MKFDLGGHELAALKGAKKLFKTYPIGSIMLELGDIHINFRTFLGEV